MTNNDDNRAVVLSFVSGKGGAGKTMLAVAAAYELSLVTPTIILDLDFFNRGLSGLLTHGKRIRAVEPPSFLPNNAAEPWYLMEVKDGLFTVTFPDLTASELQNLDGLQLSSLALGLKEWLHGLCSELGCHAVVIDCHGGPDSLSFAAVRVADQVLLVSEPDRITMHGTLHFLRRLADLSISTYNVHLLFNKVVDALTSAFLRRTYNQHLRSYFHNRSLLAAFPLEVYLTKYFERHPFVTEYFPKSMLARKTQVMLADLMKDIPPHRLPGGIRRVPTVLAYYWRNYSGRIPAVLNIDFVIGATFIVFLVMGLSAIIVAAAHTDMDTPLWFVTHVMSPTFTANIYWGVLTVLLSWTRGLDQRFTISARRGDRVFTTVYALLLVFVGLGMSVAAIPMNTEVADPVLLDLSGVTAVAKYGSYPFLCATLVVWLGQFYRGIGDLQYTRYRVEPATRILSAVLILGTWFCGTWGWPIWS